MAHPLQVDALPLSPPLPADSLIERIEDEQLIRQFLMRDRYAHAYLLGKLDPLYAPFCRWYCTRTPEGDVQDLLLWYQGLSIPVAFLAASPSRDPRPFFRACCAELPSRFHFHIIGEQLGAFREICPVASSQKMHRMGLERSLYKRQPTPQHVQIERLGHRDTAAIMSLYEHYPDHFFEPYQLETGLYFGVRDPAQGELVSIAGVHVISPEHDVAVIGNLVTHPSSRGQGLATACTGRLLDELFERVSFVALNVQANNTPAIRMYANFMFEPNNVFSEGRCES